EPVKRTLQALFAADVLLAADLADLQPGVLQGLEAGIDHVRVAAEVGDVGGGIRRALGQELLHVAAAHVGMRLRRQFPRQAGQVAEMSGVGVGEGAELLAVQQLAGRSRALQQHHLQSAPGDQVLDLRQHRAVRRHAGARRHQQVAAIVVAGQQAEPAVRPAGVDGVSDLQALEQGGGGATGDVADRDLDRAGRARQRVRALGRRAVAVVEMDLQELPRDERERLAIGAGKAQVGDGRRQHAARHELERELDDGQGGIWDREFQGEAAGGRTRVAYTTGMLPQTPHDAPALQVRDLRKTYDNGVEALKGVSLDVAPGDFFAMLGPNGAGQSTLIGIVTSLVNKTAGDVRVFGVDIARERDAAMRLLGLVPQEINFNMFENPRDILVNYAGFYGIPRREALARAEQELKAAQLWDKADKMARTLSGGMKRRLMIARAMMTRPRLLILDEPTAGVDIEIR